ncbi:hypothetical protein cypCar_00038822 [Cyprinus carpio]|nr:hypothetical protein cypCar_00038822 [Cyprinus carpio]
MLFQIYGEKRRQFNLVRNNPREIVEKDLLYIERLLAKKRKALEGENIEYYNSKAEMDYVSTSINCP